jgi:hypothetical protein
VGELYRPGRPVRPPLPLSPERDVVKPPRPQPARRVVLRCNTCGRLFHDPLLAMAHQEEHVAKGEKPCFTVVEAS